MTVKPLLVAPFITVSMTAPTIMMQAVVMEPLLRPILSPMAPSRHMPRMMPAGGMIRCQHNGCRDNDASCREGLPSLADGQAPVPNHVPAHVQQAHAHEMIPSDASLRSPLGLCAMHTCALAEICHFYNRRILLLPKAVHHPVEYCHQRSARRCAGMEDSPMIWV